MTEPVTPTDKAPQGAPATVHDPLAETFPATREGKVLFGIAIAFSTFQLLTAAGLLGLPSQVVRSVHVGFLMLLVFPLLATLRQARPSIRAAAWVLGIIGMGVGLYQFIEYEPLILRAGEPLPIDTVIGVLSLAVLLSPPMR
jgi:TRAP-type uncharacterized transport system fused permease subunit